MNGTCKAFTLNTNPKIKKGPNHLLKGSLGRADGNRVAFSAQFLSGAETDPGPITIDVIEPKTALFENRCSPGGDLFN